MALWVDGNLVDSAALNGAKLRERIAALQVKLDVAGRVLHSITIGDQTYWDLDGLPDPGKHDVHVQTCTYEEYAKEAAEDIRAFVERLVTRLEGCADRLSSGKGDDAFADFSRAVEGIRWVMQAGPEIHRFDHPESDLEKCPPFRHLRQQLQAADGLLETKAGAQLASTVRGELIPAIQDFVNYVTPN